MSYESPFSLSSYFHSQSQDHPYCQAFSETSQSFFYEWCDSYVSAENMISTVLFSTWQWSENNSVKLIVTQALFAINILDYYTLFAVSAFCDPQYEIKSNQNL